MEVSQLTTKLTNSEGVLIFSLEPPVASKIIWRGRTLTFQFLNMLCLTRQTKWWTWASRKMSKWLCPPSKDTALPTFNAWCFQLLSLAGSKQLPLASSSQATGWSISSETWKTRHPRPSLTWPSTAHTTTESMHLLIFWCVTELARQLSSLQQSSKPTSFFCPTKSRTRLKSCTAILRRINVK